MNIFRFPRTAEAVRSHIRGRVPQSLRFGAAAAIFTLAFGLSLPAMARAPVATANAELARSIRSAAHGKPWLERTLWGLPDQARGWNGDPVVNRQGPHYLVPPHSTRSGGPKNEAP